MRDGSRPRPDHVTTVRRFIDSMRQLKAWSGLSYRQIEARARADGDTLPYSTVATMLRSDSLPRVELVATFTRACGCDAGDVDEWIRTRRRLAVELSREAADDPPTSPRELPAEPAVFVGRRDELDRLRGLLTCRPAEPSRTVVISGAAGVGKSTLAVRAAWAAAGHFPNGLLYVNLLGATPGMRPLQPVEALGRFLRSLGLPPELVPSDQEEAAARFRTLVAERRLLVVLDDAASVSQVRLLVPAGRGCVALVTSRQWLAPLEGAVGLCVDTLPTSESEAMLGRIPGAERVAADPETRRKLVELCGHLPLALRIAGARLANRPDWPVSYLVARLADEKNRLAELQIGDLAVRSSLMVSYSALANGDDLDGRVAARVFRLFGTVALADIDRLAGAALLDLPADRVGRALEVLADASLVTSHEPGRYRMHDLVRLAAAELAEVAEPELPREAAMTRLLRHYLVAVQWAVRLMDPHRIHGGEDPDGGVPAHLADRTQATAWLDIESPNILTVVGRALEGSDEIARLGLRVANPLYYYLQYRAHIFDMSSVSRGALVVARRLGDSRAEASAHYNLAWLARRRCDFADARAHLEAQLRISRRLGERVEECRTLGSLAFTHSMEGRPEAGLPLAEQLLTLARQVGSATAERFALWCIGQANRMLGQYDQAVAYVRHGLTLAEQAGDVFQQGFLLSELGKIHLDQGDLVPARDYLLDGLCRLSTIGDRLEEAETRADLARARRLLGDLDGALTDARQAVRLAHTHAPAETEARMLVEYGKVLTALGDSEGAQRAHEESSRICEQLGIRAPLRL